MHLYKPSYSDIPNPKLGGQKTSDSAAKVKKTNAAPKTFLPLRCWAMTLNSSMEQKCLERFVYVHGLSLKDTVKAETGMIYR